MIAIAMLEMLLCLPNLPELLISTKWEIDVCVPFCLAAILREGCK